MTLPAWASLHALVNVILLLLAAEALWLTARHRRSHQGGSPPLWLHLISGALLLLALKLVLVDTEPLLVMGVLGVAGLAHLADLRATLTPATHNASSRDG